MHGLRRELALALKVSRGEGGRRDEPRERREVAVLLDGGVEVRRDEGNAVHRNAELRLQEVSDAGTAESAIAFADEVLAGFEAIVFDTPVKDGRRGARVRGCGG